MSKMSGAVVSSTNQSTVNTKFGPKPTYTFDANGVQYRTNFKPHGLNVGDVVDFEYSTGKYGNDVDVASINKTESGAPVPSASAAAALTPIRQPANKESGYNKGVFPIPALDGQRSIVRQNALTNARELVMKTVKDGSLISNIDVVANGIIELARKFEAYSCGDIEADMIAAEVSAEKKAA